MVWLQATEENGNALYLDIQRVERRRGAVAVTAVLGDGHGEAEVLVELGERVEVTFLDEWLPGRRLPEFIVRAGSAALAKAVAGVAVDLALSAEQLCAREAGPRPKPAGLWPEGGRGVAEAQAVWQLGAA